MDRLAEAVRAPPPPRDVAPAFHLQRAPNSSRETLENSSSESSEAELAGTHSQSASRPLLTPPPTQQACTRTPLWAQKGGFASKRHRIFAQKQNECSLWRFLLAVFVFLALPESNTWQDPRVCHRENVQNRLGCVKTNCSIRVLPQIL